MISMTEVHKRARIAWMPCSPQTLLAILLPVTLIVANSSFNVQYWMSLLYPVMTATSFMAMVVMLLYYISVRPVRLVLATVFYLASETVVLALLTLTTGAYPVLDIEQYRPLVAWTRFFNWLALIWIIRDGASMVFRDIEKLKKEKQ